MTTELITTSATPAVLTAFAGLGDETGYENVEDVNVRAFIQLANHKNHLEWADGIKFGDIYNTLTGEICHELLFIPCYVHKYVAEYEGTNKFVKQHSIDSEEYQKACAKAIDKKTNRIKYKEVKSDSGNTLTASHDVYALVSHDGGDTWMPAVIPMQSSKIKPYERFFKTLRLRQTRLFENVCQLGVKEQKGDDGAFFNYTFKWIGCLQDESLARMIVEYIQQTKISIAEREDDSL